MANSGWAPSSSSFTSSSRSWSKTFRKSCAVDENGGAHVALEGELGGATAPQAAARPPPARPLHPPSLCSSNPNTQAAAQYKHPKKAPSQGAAAQPLSVGGLPLASTHGVPQPLPRDICRPSDWWLAFLAWSASVFCFLLAPFSVAGMVARRGEERADRWRRAPALMHPRQSVIGSVAGSRNRAGCWCQATAGAQQDLPRNLARLNVASCTPRLNFKFLKDSRSKVRGFATACSCPPSPRLCACRPRLVVLPCEGRQLC